MKYIEIAGVVFSLLYLFYSIKQNLISWTFGFLSAVFYIIFYFEAKYFALASLNFYYLFVSIYGYYSWKKGDKKTSNADNDSSAKAELQVTYASPAYLFKFAGLSLILSVLLYYGLSFLKESSIPLFDGPITAFSIIATYMVACKKIQAWILWIVVDFTSCIVFFIQEYYLTSFLYLAFTIMAASALFAWIKDYKKINHV